MDNYPPGAASDPRAPHNQKDPIMQECDDCGGTGIIEQATTEYEAVTCGKCDGSGEIEVEAFDNY